MRKYLEPVPRRRRRGLAFTIEKKGQILNAKEPFWGQSQGQALFEFLVMLVVAIAVIITLTTGFRRTILSLWGFYIRQVSAPCPGCPSDTRYRFR